MNKTGRSSIFGSDRSGEATTVGLDVSESNGEAIRNAGSEDIITHTNQKTFTRNPATYIAIITFVVVGWVVNQVGMYYQKIKRDYYRLAYRYIISKTSRLKPLGGCFKYFAMIKNGVSNRLSRAWAYVTSKESTTI